MYKHILATVKLLVISLKILFPSDLIFEIKIKTNNLKFVNLFLNFFCFLNFYSLFQDMCGPAPALNPSINCKSGDLSSLGDNNGFVTVSNSSKKKKKSRNNSNQQQSQQQTTTIHTTTLDQVYIVINSYLCCCDHLI